MDEENIFTPLKEEEERNFSFCNEEENPFAPSISNNDILDQASQRAILNMQSQKRCSTLTHENYFMLNSMAPTKEELFVPNFMDNGRINSNHQLLCVKEPFFRAREVYM